MESLRLSSSFILSKSTASRSSADRPVSINEQVGDVILPLWSNQCPYNYVRVNRSALEHGIVSRSLNNWIDLIWGYKQRGENAVKSDNLFYYLTYSDSVNIEKIDDLEYRNTLLQQIDNFGQVPTQLFSESHPFRNEEKKLFYMNNKNIRMIKINESILGLSKIWINCNYFCCCSSSHKLILFPIKRNPFSIVFTESSDFTAEYV